MSVKRTGARSGASPRRLRNIAIITLLMLAMAGAQTAAQQPDIAPELLARMTKEKEARRACKVEICTAFAKPATGSCGSLYVNGMSSLYQFLRTCRSKSHPIFIVFDFFRNTNNHISIDLAGANIASHCIMKGIVKVLLPALKTE